MNDLQTVAQPISDQPTFSRRRLVLYVSVASMIFFAALLLQENWRAMQGRQRFADWIDVLNRTRIFAALEVVLIGIPILAHAFIGIADTLSEGTGVRAKWAARNWAYFVKPATELFAVLFVAYYLICTRVPALSGTLNGGGYFDAVTRSLSTTWMGVPVAALGYMIGLGSLAFCLAAGLRETLACWGGRAPGPASMRATIIVGAIGVLFFAFGANTAIYFATGSKILAPPRSFAGKNAPLLDYCTPSLLRPGPAVPTILPGPAASLLRGAEPVVPSASCSVPPAPSR